MVDIKTVISSKHRLRLIDSIKSIVITIKTTDLKRHRLYPTETHENRRQSTILPMKSFVWVVLCSGYILSATHGLWYHAPVTF